MSVQHESVGMGKGSERAEVAPELEYRAISQDSLSMFLAAIGGAVLGMLLTLLILALINGGTLSYAGARLETVETRLQQVDENVGAVSANMNIVSEQAAAIQQQLGAVETSLRGEIETQGSDLAALNESVVTLNQTRQQFDIFVGAMASALTEMGAITPSTDNPTGTSETTEVVPTIDAPEGSEPLVGPPVITATTGLTATPPLTATEEFTPTGSLTATDTLTDSAAITPAETVTE